MCKTFWLYVLLLLLFVMDRYRLVGYLFLTLHLGSLRYYDNIPRNANLDETTQKIIKVRI